MKRETKSTALKITAAVVMGIAAIIPSIVMSQAILKYARNNIVLVDGDLFLSTNESLTLKVNVPQSQMHKVIWDTSALPVGAEIRIEKNILTITNRAYKSLSTSDSFKHDWEANIIAFYGDKKMTSKTITFYHNPAILGLGNLQKTPIYNIGSDWENLNFTCNPIIAGSSNLGARWDMNFSKNFFNIGFDVASASDLRDYVEDNDKTFGEWLDFKPAYEYQSGALISNLMFGAGSGTGVNRSISTWNWHNAQMGWCSTKLNAIKYNSVAKYDKFTWRLDNFQGSDNYTGYIDLNFTIRSTNSPDSSTLNLLDILAFKLQKDGSVEVGFNKTFSVTASLNYDLTNHLDNEHYVGTVDDFSTETEPSTAIYDDLSNLCYLKENFVGTKQLQNYAELMVDVSWSEIHVGKVDTQTQALGINGLPSANQPLDYVTSIDDFKTLIRYKKKGNDNTVDGWKYSSPSFSFEEGVLYFLADSSLNDTTRYAYYSSLTITITTPGGEIGFTTDLARIWYQA